MCSRPRHIRVDAALDVLRQQHLNITNRAIVTDMHMLRRQCNDAICPQPCARRGGCSYSHSSAHSSTQRAYIRRSTTSCLALHSSMDPVFGGLDRAHVPYSAEYEDNSSWRTEIPENDSKLRHRGGFRMARRQDLGARDRPILGAHHVDSLRLSLGHFYGGFNSISAVQSRLCQLRRAWRRRCVHTDDVPLRSEFLGRILASICQRWTARPNRYIDLGIQMLALETATPNFFREQRGSSTCARAHRAWRGFCGTRTSAACRGSTTSGKRTRPGRFSACIVLAFANECRGSRPNLLEAALFSCLWMNR
jgi:hypothetical protein